jgi:hypothetical protein
MYHFKSIILKSETCFSQLLRSKKFDYPTTVFSFSIFKRDLMSVTLVWTFRLSPVSVDERLLAERWTISSLYSFFFSSDNKSGCLKAGPIVLLQQEHYSEPTARKRKRRSCPA